MIGGVPLGAGDADRPPLASQPRPPKLLLGSTRSPPAPVPRLLGWPPARSPQTIRGLKFLSLTPWRSTLVPGCPAPGLDSDLRPTREYSGGIIPPRIHVGVVWICRRCRTPHRCFSDRVEGPVYLQHEIPPPDKVEAHGQPMCSCLGLDLDEVDDGALHVSSVGGPSVAQQNRSAYNSYHSRRQDSP